MLLSKHACASWSSGSQSLVTGLTISNGKLYVYNLEHLSVGKCYQLHLSACVIRAVRTICVVTKPVEDWASDSKSALDVVEI